MSEAARPAEFDARVLAYKTMLQNMAKRLVPVDDREDLVQSAMTRALDNWADCGEGFASWLRFQLLAEYRKYRALRRPVPAMVRSSVVETEEPSQEDVIAIGQSLARVRNPILFLATAIGYDLAELGEMMGMSKQGVGLKISRDRKNLPAGGAHG